MILFKVLVLRLSQPGLLRENKAFDTASTYAGSSELMRVAAAPTGVQVDEINAYSYVYPVGVSQQLPEIRWYV